MAMSKADILNEISRLNAELPIVKKIAEISDHEGLEIAFNELTENCCNCVKSKAFKASKSALKELETVNNFKEFLERKKERVIQIENKIAELKIELTRYQLNFFDEQNVQKIPTDIKHENREIYTGDVYETPNREYLIIIESEEHPTNYAIIGTAFTEELLLQYPKNRMVLNNTAYLGNLFDDNKLAEFVDRLTEKQEELQQENAPEISEENQEAQEDQEDQE